VPQWHSTCGRDSKKAIDLEKNMIDNRQRWTEEKVKHQLGKQLGETIIIGE